MTRDDDDPSDPAQPGVIPLTGKDVVNLLAEMFRAEHGAPPERPPPSLDDGRLDQINLREVLEQACAAGRTGSYEVVGKRAPGIVGSCYLANVYLSQGRIVSAVFREDPGLDALDALAELFAWGDGQYFFLEGVTRGAGRPLAGTAREILQAAEERRAANLSRSQWELRAGRRRLSQTRAPIVEVWLRARVDALEFLHDVSVRPELVVGHDPRFLLSLSIERVAPEGLGLEAGTTVNLGIHSAAQCGLGLNESEHQTYEFSIEREERADGACWDELHTERGPL